MFATVFRKILSFFTGNNGIFIAIIIGLLAIMIIPNSSAILEKFDVETRASLKADKATLEVALDTAVAANESNIQMQAVKEEIEDISHAAATRIDARIKKRDTVVNTLTSKHQQAIAIATTKPITDTAPLVDAPPVPPVAVIEAVSEANITLLWDTFNTIESNKGV